LTATAAAVIAVPFTVRCSLIYRCFVGGDVPLRIDVDHSADRPTFTLAGELDMLTAPQLTSRVLRMIQHCAADLALDVRRLEFCDSSGLAALVRLAQQLDGGALTIIGPRPVVRRLLDVSGMIEVFVVVDAAPISGPPEHAAVSPA
jgi:anti-sigma B factor antagonist